MQRNNKNFISELTETEEEISLQNFKEEKFTLDMQSVGMKILKVQGDGNCLFRSIAL